MRYNKVKTGIDGLDRLLYDGLVVPDKGENLLIVIRGADNTEKTVLSLQLLTNIAQCINQYIDKPCSITYHCNYLKKSYIEDLLLDMLIATAIKKIISNHVQGISIAGCKLTESFFDTTCIQAQVPGNVYCNYIPVSSIEQDPDGMICHEALYYNNRTNALHLRLKHQEDNTSDDKNIIYPRKYERLNDYIKKDSNNNGNKDNKDRKEDGNELKNVEACLGVKYTQTDIEEMELCLNKIRTKLSSVKDEEKLLTCVNLVNTHCNHFQNSDICILMDELKKYRISLLVVRDDVDVPMEKADMVLNLQATNYESSDYLLHYLEIYKSRFQTTAIGRHQYKRRDYGVEVYPSLHRYCQQRRYLQRALVYTHSNVIRETFQQYLDYRNEKNVTYEDYLNECDEISSGYFNALSPSAYKNFSLYQIMDNIFIHPITGKRNINEQRQTENEFLYGNNGGITAVIGEANTYKRFLTIGSAFSSAYRHEHTLLLLLNKDYKMVRRRMQCPARKNKCNENMCCGCYKYLHFMNIVLGCITPEEFIYFLMQQIDTKFPDGKIKRIIIDDLQIVEYCFPFLFCDPLFISTLFDECRDRQIALYVLCDKNSRMTEQLKVLADNVVCTDKTSKGELRIYVERYSGYYSKASKVFSGEVSDTENLFECYEQGSKDNQETIYGFNADKIDDKVVHTTAGFWNRK